jgi:hypothetical protein
MISFEANLICDGTDRFLPFPPRGSDGKDCCEVVVTGEPESSSRLALADVTKTGLKKGWTFDHGKNFCPGCSKFIAKGAKALLGKYKRQNRRAA